MNLQEEIESRIAASGATVAVAIHDLATGNEILINADRSFHPASTMKICLMMEVFRQAEQGVFNLSDHLVVRNEFRSIADHSPFGVSMADDSDPELFACIGQTKTILSLVEHMITLSSNLSTNLLIELVTPPKVQQFMRDLGALDISIVRGIEDQRAFDQGFNNAITARGLAQILAKLARLEVVSASASQAMIGILQRQTHREGIPAGLPSKTLVANKTGSITSIFHDAAIVYPAHRPDYVLVVLTQGMATEPEAHKLVAEMSRITFDRLNVRP